MRKYLSDRCLMLQGISLLISLICICEAGAQDGVSQSGSYTIAKAPALSKWTIEYRNAARSEGSAIRATSPDLMGKRILKTEITKTESVKNEKSLFEGGLHQEIWVTHDSLVLKDPSYPHVIVRRNANVGNDFPELKWIAKDHYRGKARLEGKECDVFQTEMYPLEFADPSLYAAEMAQEAKSIDLGTRVPVVAYIDPVTKLPAKLTVGEDVRVYSFQEPPQVALELPVEFASAVDSVVKRRNALTRPLSKP